MYEERIKELKSCPFCGESKFLEVESKERKDRPQCKFTATVSCLMCHGRAGNHGFDWTEEEAVNSAIKAWNRRYAP